MPAQQSAAEAQRRPFQHPLTRRIHSATIFNGTQPLVTATPWQLARQLP
jgi:hypothetical protein